MDANINTFESRWDAVCRETLSAVRRECNAYSFDNSAVDRAFRSGYSEWFDGRLAPRLWYDTLETERPEVAHKFKEYITHIQLTHRRYSKPSRAVSYVASLISLPVCYFAIDLLTGMGMLSKVLTTVGTAILVWYACQALIKNKESRLEEEIVDSYRSQLDSHLNALRKILSK